MSRVQKVSCELADDREVYMPGEAVNVQWVVTVGESFHVTGIRISFVGVTYVKWSEGLSVRANRSRDVITNQWTDVLAEVNYTKDGQNYVIPAGMHHYKFNFKLPEHAIPSSYEGVCGAVRYWLKLAIHRSSLLHAEKARYKPITVLDFIDVNAAAFRNGVERKAEVKVPRVLALGDQGSEFLHAETDRAAYCPGEEILISVNARNKSEKDYGIVEASLIQKTLLFFSPSTTRIARKQLVLRTVHGPPLLKVLSMQKTTEIWRNHPIKIDPIPPSTRDGTCLLITVSYFVKVTIKATSVWPFAEFEDIIVKLPITIVTTPRGLESSAVEATESTIDVDLSETCDFMYTPCEKGFEYFSDDGNDFPAIKYKPFCVCMQDLRSNATATKDGKAVASDAVPSITVQPLPSNDNKY